jgi:hypothetical protein
MPRERTQFPARGSIPEFDCVVIAARRQRLPVRRKGDGMNLVVVAGFTKVKSLRGGILAWVDKIDLSLPKY